MRVCSRETWAEWERGRGAESEEIERQRGSEVERQRGREAVRQRSKQAEQQRGTEAISETEHPVRIFVLLYNTKYISYTE